MLLVCNQMQHSDMKSCWLTAYFRNRLTRGQQAAVSVAQRCSSSRGAQSVMTPTAQPCDVQCRRATGCSNDVTDAREHIVTNAFAEPPGADGLLARHHPRGFAQRF